MNGIERNLRRTSFFLSVAVVLVAGLVLVGWQFDIEMLKRPIPKLVAMNPVTAFLFVLSGVAVLFQLIRASKRSSNVSLVLAFIVTGVAVVRLFEIISSIEIGADRFLFSDKLEADAMWVVSNNMAPNTALCFTVIAISIIKWTRNSNTTGEKFGNGGIFGVLILGFFSVLGYFYGVSEFYSILAYFPMSIHSAVCFIMVALSLLLANTESEFMKTFASPHAGGRLSRKFIPTLILAIVAIGFFRVWLSWNVSFSIELGEELLIIVIASTLIWFIHHLSKDLNSRDEERLMIRQQLEGFNAELESKVKERTKSLQCVKRLYAFNSAINQSIVHIRDRQELLDKACSVALEIGEFNAAWLSLVDADGLLVLQSSGGDKDIVAGLESYSGLDYSSAELRNSFTGMVLQTGEYVMVNRLMEDPSIRPWAQRFLQHGLRSLIVLPITKFKKVVGVYCLVSDVEDDFDAAEITLLKEAAGDISFALEVMDQEKLRLEAEAERDNMMLQLEERVDMRTKELAQKNRDILDSINYAKRIQASRLCSESMLHRIFPKLCFLSMPKDIVSGDFFWCYEKVGKKFIAVADCTGHGVPGALMSIIGNGLLDHIVINEHIENPSEILTLLDKRLKEAVKGDLGEVKDGMDIVLCMIDTQFNELYFAGALRPLFVVDVDAQVSELVGNRHAIGGGISINDKMFTTARFPIVEGQRIYLSSDGYYSQFGGPKGKKFMKSTFKKTLMDLQSLPIDEHALALKTIYTEWQGDNEQVDDVMVMGIEL